MPTLYKQYPQNPQLNRKVFTDSIDNLRFHLDAIEKRIKENQVSKCGKVFTEFIRVDLDTLNTCIYNNFDTEEEESKDVNYMIM